ncbi:MAG: phosphoribosylformylglycinamidine synthase [Lachnospiraceae bacterium]|nr:phosphoribosylformylglycinamidine synthase [Lachnospiraceae bacterium]
MVYRIFVEKKEGNDLAARELLQEGRELLGIAGLERLRLLNRYDVEDVTPALFENAVRNVFSDPSVDYVYEEPDLSGAAVFAVEYLPGQFDQRADSAAQCIQIISRGDRPAVASARVYALYGAVSEAELAAFKKHVINPVEAREASLEKPETLKMQYDAPEPVAVLTGFRDLDRDGLAAFVRNYGLAMDEKDIAFCQNYFKKERRDPTITEIRMIDTYWSDHCRHTTFLTELTDVSFEDPRVQKTYEEYLALRRDLKVKKPVCLMDLATIAVKELKRQGKLDKLDESEEINACTVKMEVRVDGKPEPWLLLFKNETHNHPTEIEPFGGAATCIGGAIRDPLSGRAYVYGAMRVTGAADPTVPLSETIPGKLPQRSIVTGAAAGYSSYGNQIGLATGLVDELYHPGYAAKRMEIGAVIAAAPAENVRREQPVPGDVVILLGGATGRDGIGGATGSSKAHDSHSVETCGAEVQKGNAPEERKLQRLFRDPEATRLIKRCNDFGAGGVSVAIGELADGLSIDLDKVPKKYEGLDGTELAISESQERMAVVVDPADLEHFLALAAGENLSAVPVARVTKEPRLVMHWNGARIVDVSRDFLNSNGAPKEAAARVLPPRKSGEEARPVTDLPAALREMVSSLAYCSRQGLSERFDSTIGAATVLMPFGGIYQKTPIQAMVHKIPLLQGETDTCSAMAYGFDPYLSESDPYRGAYLAVVESVSKLVAAGAGFDDVYLSFQEYFEKLGRDPERWGKPLAALLGAFRAQLDLGYGAIGGKDSMSGSFEDIHVPPTLVSFAVTTAETGQIASPELKEAGNRLVLLSPETDEDGLPQPDSLKIVFAQVTKLLREKKAVSAWALGSGGLADAVFKMAIGNRIGAEFDASVPAEELFAPAWGSFLLEMTGTMQLGREIARTVSDPALIRGADRVSLEELETLYEARLEPVYKLNDVPAAPSVSLAPVCCCAARPAEKTRPAPETAARGPLPLRAGQAPSFLIPVFPGTNCEFDSARAVERAGMKARVMVIRNRSAQEIAGSVDEFAEALKEAQGIFIPGGFSGGDEPEGSAKFITAFFRNEAVKEGVTDLMDRRGGLILGICNGFQALIKLGLIHAGRILDAEGDFPTLTFNTIGRHQSRLVRTRVESVRSPWLSLMNEGDIVTVPVSHGEGRFTAPTAMLEQLVRGDQIATRYVDRAGLPSMEIAYNPNGSLLAVEGLTSPDGRILGKMGHSERTGRHLYRNVPGEYDLKLFEAAAKYFRG